MEKEYIISFEECLEKINGVCDSCGGNLEPIKTVDNAGNPTHWSGCRHCNKFCWGINKEIFDIAREMVEKENYVAYSHIEDPRHKKDIKPEDVEYYFERQTAGAVCVVMDVLRIQKKLITKEPLCHKTS